MSSILGLRCLRSSPSLSLAAAARSPFPFPLAFPLSLPLPLPLPSHARLSCARASTTATDIRTGLPRGFSAWSSSSTLRLPWRPPSAPTLSQPQRRTLFGRRSPSILTSYLDLPADYRDAEGLPFRKAKELTSSETSRSFPGMAITPTLATRLLKILHGRRVAGTLDDPSLRVNTSMFSQEAIDKALELLRREVPVDEILNAGLRAEDELRELEADEAAQDGPSATRKKPTSPSVYGESVLDRMRAANIARAEAQAKAEAEQRKKEEEAAAQNWGGLTPYDPALHRGLLPQQLQYYEAASSGLEAPPDLPPWRLLLPTTACVAAALAFLYLLVTHAAPPRPGSALETKLTVGALVALNAAVFVAWKRVRLWKFLNQHFILDLAMPRPYQPFTAMFTHHEWLHFVKNMAPLAVGGILLVPEIGAVPFVATYFAAGTCGFLASMVAHIASGQRRVYLIGASSASFGALCAYFWLYRFDGFKVLGLPPDPLAGVQGLGIIAFIIAYFALGPMARRQGGGAIDHVAHLFGMLTGVGCAAVLESRWKLAKERDALRRGGVHEDAVKEGAAAVDVVKETAELRERSG